MRSDNRIVWRLWSSLLLLLALVISGVAGFMIIEDHSFLDALFMTVITMSTVGFGLIHDLSAEGKLFVSFLIVASTGTFVYTITNITTFVLDGHIQAVLQKIKILRNIHHMQQHIIVCGLGRNGREAAAELIRQQQAFVVIERSDEIIAEFRAAFPGVPVLQGDATHDEVLDQANIAKAKGLLTALSEDADNVYITLSAREKNPSLKIIARANYESAISKLRRAGADEIILPTLIGGRRMANLITRPALMEFMDLITGEGNDNLNLEVVECKGHPQLTGKTLIDLNVRSQTGAIVIGIKSGEQSVELTPSANRRLDADDRLFILGNADELLRFRKLYLV